MPSILKSRPVWFVAGLLALAGLIALDAVDKWALIKPASDGPMAGGAGYAGSAACIKCHKAIHADYVRSGHPFKIQKVEGKPPTFPSGTSPGVPSPPAGMSWADISYVIGGYGWKARFMDREGYILTGKLDRQYNLANDTLGLAAGWTGYDAETAPRKPYTCGECHTTGWSKTGPKGPHQDSLKGIHGTWREPGVTCEACHGPAAAHAANPTQAKLSTKPNCEVCHVRGDVATIDASGGLVNHHEQYEELLASPHRVTGCLACHDSHKTTIYDGGGFLGEKKTCLKCHEKQGKALLAKATHRDCGMCHMPLTGKSAVATTVAYKGGAVPKGDIRSHIFRIKTDPDWTMFTDDGNFVRVDSQGRAFLSVDYACLGCHVTRDKAWAAGNAPRIHAGR